MANKSIKKFNQEFTVISQITDDILCFICSNILTDAMYGPCGCQYCYGCIQKWLQDGNKKCPGKQDECNETVLDCNKNISPDIRAQKKIERLTVSCPNKFCDFQGNLKKVMDHMVVCDFSTQLQNCPFVEIGCHVKQLSMDAVKAHIRNDAIIHSLLLVKTISGMRNDIKSNKMKDFKRLENNIMELQRTLCEETQETKRNLQERISHELETQAQLGALQKRITILSTTNNNNNHQNVYEQRERQRRSRSQFYEAFSESSSLENECFETIVQQEVTTSETNNSHINCVRRRSVDRRRYSYSTNARADVTPKQELNEEEIHNPFKWKINEVTKKMSTTTGIIFSETFYRNGYNFCLKANLNRIGHPNESTLLVSFIIVHGLYDDRVMWPMANKVRIYLINQNTDCEFQPLEFSYQKISEEWKHCFFKPRKGHNPETGLDYVVPWKNIKRNMDIFRDDSIMLGCKVFQ